MTAFALVQLNDAPARLRRIEVWGAAVIFGSSAILGSVLILASLTLLTGPIPYWAWAGVILFELVAASFLVGALSHGGSS